MRWSWYYFKRNFRRRFCLVCKAFAIFIVTAFVIHVIVKSQLILVDPGIIQVEKCPACFGTTDGVCRALESGQLKVRDNYFWRIESMKGVWYGIWKQFPVVVKALGSRNEINLLDEAICEHAKFQQPCNVQNMVFGSFLNPSNSFKSSVKEAMECPSNHFVDLLEKHYYNNMGVVQEYQKIMVLTNLYFNQEHLFLQMFSKKYPSFLPKLYGACGRTVVVQYVGPTLSSALSFSWLERVKLSLKLIQLAQEFTRTVDNLALYLYDVVMSNFAIDNDGNVKLIDCEHILIVDMSNVTSTYAIKSEDSCSPSHSQCLTFIPSDLCQGESQDHNYYAICRNLLAGIGGSLQAGLLHSPPLQLTNVTRLHYLLHNCVYSRQLSREDAIFQLESELRTYLRIME